MDGHPVAAVAASAATAAEYDETTLWSFYDILPEDAGGSIVRLSDRPIVSGGDVDDGGGGGAEGGPADCGGDGGCGGGGTAPRTVRFLPGLSVRVRLPLSLMEDGCVGEVGALVWGCSVALARHLATGVGGGGEGGGVDVGMYDHIIEVGSGLGALGLALHCLLSREADGGCRRVTLTDCVPALLDSLRLAAGEAWSGAPGEVSSESSGGEVSLSVERLDWFAVADGADSLRWITPGESLLIVGSEVVYEPSHAAALSETVRRLLLRSGNWESSRVMIANGADRPGWADFVRRMRNIGPEAKWSVRCGMSFPFVRGDGTEGSWDEAEDSMLLDIYSAATDRGREDGGVQCAGNNCDAGT